MDKKSSSKKAAPLKKSIRKVSPEGKAEKSKKEGKSKRGKVNFDI